MPFTKTSYHYDDEFSKNDVPTKVRIGGSLENKFVPNINASKWNDEAWLNINFPQVVSNQIATFDGSVIEQTIGDYKHRFYQDVDGNLEYEIVLNKKPPPNVNSFTLNIDFSPGLVFFYQPALTQEELDAGDFRPGNVIGSYAVFWNKKNNQYRTGKLCHIYRPHLKDSIGNETWANLNIDSIAKTLTISVDSNWLKNAIYPITIDPTIGYTSIGGTLSSASENAVCASRFACTADGTTAAATVYSYCSSNGFSGRNMSIAAYADNAGTVAGQSKISTSDCTFTMSLTAAWNSGAITPPAFSSGTKYWIATHAGSQCATYYDSATPGYEDAEYYSRTYSTPMPDPFSSSVSSQAREYSLYINYTAAGEGLDQSIKRIALGG